MKKILYLVLIFLIALIISLLFDIGIASFFAYNRVALFDSFIVWLSSIFTGFVTFLIITCLFLWQERKRKWIIPLFASFFSTSIVVVILKFVIGRIRPFVALNLPLMAEVDYAFRWWDSSFPSFHAAAAFCTIAILDREFPRIKWFWIIFALLIAFSRLYMGVHYLSDIIGGALIGYMIGKLFVFVEEKHKIFKLRTKLKRIWH